MNPNQPPSGNPNPPQNPPDLASQVQALQKAFADIQPFIEDSSYLVAAIYADPQLKSVVQNRLKDPNYNMGTQQPQPPAPQPGQPQPPAPQPPVPQNQPQPRFDPYTGQPLGTQTPPTMSRAEQTRSDIFDIDSKMREDIIAQVEAKLGYTNMEPAARKELRKSVEKRLNMWNFSVTSAPVNALPKLLEDAYLLTDLKPAKEQGRAEGLIEAYSNNMGALPSMGGANPQPETTQLTPGHEEWTKKFGLNQDKVTSRLKEFQETGVMTYRPPEQAQPTGPAAPSGQPQPPAAPAPQNQPQPQQ